VSRVVGAAGKPSGKPSQKATAAHNPTHNQDHAILTLSEEYIENLQLQVRGSFFILVNNQKPFSLFLNSTLELCDCRCIFEYMWVCV